jgi:hypothetical protein
MSVALYRQGWVKTLSGLEYLDTPSGKRCWRNPEGYFLDSDMEPTEVVAPNLYEPACAGCLGDKDVEKAEKAVAAL